MKHFPFGFTGLLAAALVVGVAGDLLLRVGPPGVNFTIWSVATLAMVAALAPRAGVFREFSARTPLAAAIFFSLLFVWRDAEPIKALLIAVIVGSVALSAAAAMGRSMRAAHVLDYAFDGFNFGLGVVSLPIALLTRPRPAVEDPRGAASVPVLAVVRGVLIAAPFLALFGILLVSADAMFEKLVGEVFDIQRMASHVFLSAVCAWAAAATWWLCLEPSIRPPVMRPDLTRAAGSGGIEINVALGLISLLFLSFIAVQARYLFGGHEHILKAAGLTYADYARRGFFELAAVAAFSLAILAVCSPMMESTGPLSRRIYKIVSAIWVVSVLLIVASALDRMRLYIDAYGLTRLRLYTTCFMGWMIAVFLWLYYTIFRERVRGFAYGCLLSGYAATFLLVASNPDNRVAATNLSRAMHGKSLSAQSQAASHDDLDTEYIGDLSADAIPVILRRFADLSPEDQAGLRESLAKRRTQLEKRDWRTWTIGFQRGDAALKNFSPASPPGKSNKP